MVLNVLWHAIYNQFGYYRRPFWDDFGTFPETFSVISRLVESILASERANVSLKSKGGAQVALKGFPILPRVCALPPNGFHNGHRFRRNYRFCCEFAHIFINMISCGLEDDI